MDNETLKALNYFEILAKLEKICVTHGGKEIATNLRPCNDFKLSLQNMKETTEALDFYAEEGDLPFIEFVDIEPLFDKVKVLSPVSGEEMLRVGAVLSTVSEIKEIGNAYKDSYHLIYSYTSRLSSFNEIVTKINKSIGPDGRIVDDASPLLSIIRREIKITYMRIQTNLQEILYSKANEDAIQDQIITKRNGRYVIPIRQNSHPSFQYVVQGESSSRLTLFVEPISVVELNNKLVDLAAKEKQEEERIIIELESEVSFRMRDIRNSLEMIYKLDFLFAKAKLSMELKCNEPQLTERQVLKLFGARHPLIPENRVVPIDIEVGDGFNMLILTGPNTGGKTVSLKTSGLLALMAKSGLHIPAYSNSEVGFFDFVFADIGDEQSIQQNLSTFSSHMARIVNILTTATEKSLVLIDELGAGTDPEEGSALGYAILKKLYDMNCKSIISTHHSRLKEFPYEFERARNACVGFDKETLRPTYAILIGVPGESHAFAIAERLGVPQEILESAKSELSEEHKITHDIISKMVEDRKEISESKEVIERERKELEELKETYERKLEEFEERKRKEIKKAYEEAQRIIDETKEKMTNILSNVESYVKGHKTILDLKKEVVEEENKIDETELHSQEAGLTATVEELKVGQVVYVKSFKRQGILLSIVPEKNKVVVQMGGIRATLPLSDVELVEDSKEGNSATNFDVRITRKEEVPIKLDLHGLTVEEALDKLDKYLDSAYLFGFSWVYIEHGRGTGVLRDAVVNFLRNHPHVSRFEIAKPSEGGIGVTIVYFK